MDSYLLGCFLAGSSVLSDKQRHSDSKSVWLESIIPCKSTTYQPGWMFPPASSHNAKWSKTLSEPELLIYSSKLFSLFLSIKQIKIMLKYVSSGVSSPSHSLSLLESNISDESKCMTTSLKCPWLTSKRSIFLVNVLNLTFEDKTTVTVQSSKK